MNGVQKEVTGFANLSSAELINISGGGATAFGTKSYYVDDNGNVEEDSYFCDFSYMLGSYCMWESDKY